MYKLGRCCQLPFRWAFVAVLVSGIAAAQTDQARSDLAGQGAFASVQESLNDVADRTLVAVLADRPWIKNSEATAAGDSHRSMTWTAPDARLRAALERVQQLRPTIEPILREEGVPGDLSAVVLVESGGQAMALSPKGARGVWQLMPDTARRYGLAVSDAHDERLDVEKSTRAAALYFRDLYQQFGDWQLAFAAYNVGEQTVGRAVARIGQRDFTLIRDALPLETRNYVRAVMAAVGRLQHQHFNDPIHVVYATAMQRQTECKTDLSKCE